ncbi:MAG: helix-turn-helix domain-containing protein, partial [Pseudomonadota bacterium]
YAFSSSVSTATGVRSLAHHPFLKALSFGAEPEPPADAAPPKANGQVAERVRITVPVPPIRFELSPRQLVDEVLSSIVGMGRWRAEVRRDETFAARDLVLPVIRGEAPAVTTAEHAVRLLGTGSYNSGAHGSLLCVWDPIDESAEMDPVLQLRATMTGQRLMSLLGQRSRQAYETARTGTRLADRLLVVMAESFGRVYKADLAAQMLKTSERTMRRRLAAEDTSFQQVLDRFRAALAKDYLATTSLPTQLIGELLGFTEATNFRRAFIRWAKVSPHQFRRQAESPLS